MRNIRLTLAYDGSDYVGWQVQPNGPSVQGAVEHAVEKLTGERVRLFAAGRTDSGVHALGQVANFPTESKIPCHKMRSGLQTFLAEDIIVRDVSEVADDFHATHFAKSKRYRYVIHNALTRNPFVRKYTWFHHGDLDMAAMQEAARAVVGRHDFRCFETQFPNKATSVRTVTELSVARYSICPTGSESTSLPSTPDGEYLCFEIVADGFLYNMVRAIVGTLAQIGRGRWPASEMARIIESQNRSQAGETAPARGLCLVSVDYGSGERETDSRNG